MKKIIFLILISLFVSNVFAQDLMDVNEMIDTIEFNLKVKNTPNGKLQAKLTNLKDPTDTFSFYTNNITQIDLQNILLAFFEKTKRNKANEDEKNKINANSFKLYAQLPTISDTRVAQETAVKIQTKNRIPVELTSNKGIDIDPTLPYTKLENSFKLFEERMIFEKESKKGINLSFLKKDMKSNFMEIDRLRSTEKKVWESDFLPISPDSIYSIKEQEWKEFRSDLTNLKLQFTSKCIGCTEKFQKMKGIDNWQTLYSSALDLKCIKDTINKYKFKYNCKYRKDNASFSLLFNTYMSFIDRFVSSSNRELVVDKIDMTFKDGYIQDLRVSGTHNGLYYTFNNVFPIGYSSKANFIKVNKQSLFENREDDGVDYKINLGDLFVNHNPELSPKTKDYSPDEQKVSFEIAQPNQWLDLKRDNTKEVIDMQIFTDLWGVGKKEPNGLVQIEVGRIFKLLTLRKQFRISSVGGLENIRVSGLLSKIEQKERFLELSSHDSLVNGRVFGANYAPAIDFFRHQTFQVGAQLNVFTFDFPFAKSMLKIDVGSHYLGSFVRGDKAVLANGTLSERRDTINDFVGSALFQPEIRWDIAATERIGGFVGYRANLMWLLNNNYSFSEGNNFNSGKRFDYFHTILAEFFYRPVNKDKLFIRASINLQPSLLSKHFTQIQLGYILNIFQNTSAKK